MAQARCTFAEVGRSSSTTEHEPAVRGELPLSLPLRHGGKAAIRVSYELTSGSKRPPIIVAGGISAGRHVISSDDFPESGWWEVQKAVFSGDHRILAIDWVGADGRVDAPLDPADQAEAIARVLSHLRIAKAAAFIGASYGAMVGMHFAARYPERLGALLGISASNGPHPFASACRSLQRQALSLGERAGDAAAGVALARSMAMLTYRTPDEFADRFTAPPSLRGNRLRVAADGYLDAHGARHCQRMDAVAYRRLSESIDLHRLEPAQIKVPLTLGAADRDALVPADDVRSLAEAVPGARFHLIKSIYGHDAFLKEQEQVGAIITQFTSSLEHAA